MQPPNRGFKSETPCGCAKRLSENFGGNRSVEFSKYSLRTMYKTIIADRVGFAVLAVWLLFLASMAVGFPDGAPADTCVKQRANQPNHGKARTQPLHSNPFEVVADSQTFHPGQQISVLVYPHSDEKAVFRGFFLQARDAHSNEWLGEWVQSENTKTIPECSAITHSDNRDKLGAKLIWKAPQNKRGHVYFTGTVLKEYGTFWSDIIAKVQAPA